MRRALLTGLALAALALPAAARAAGPVLVVRDIALGPARALAAAQPVRPFTMVALHWRGSGTVSFRTRSLGGRWSGWQPAAPEAEDLPDRASGEAAAATGWRIGNPFWTGPADRLELRTSGSVQRARAYYVWSAVQQRPLRQTSLAGSPRLIMRQAWGANERRKREPVYAWNVRFAVIHHTAGTNDYTPRQSAAIVRGIQLYHVSGNGWNDIGYNFLVDKYGQVFEGRYGGIDRPVVGAHALGFNTGSVGIAVIGGYGAKGISKAAEAAIVKLLAWRLDVAHADPLASLSWPSAGNPRFPSGVPVFLRTISGHRDTGFTSCPGDALYRRLDALAARVAVTGLPKIYEPAVTGTLGGPLRFVARLSGYASWRLTILDGDGITVASTRGTGIAVDWTWDSAAAADGAYRWILESGNSRPADGTIARRAAVPPSGTAAPALPVPTLPGPTLPAPTLPAASPAPASPATPLLGAVAVAPTVISPNGDGVDDGATVSYALRRGAFVTATVFDQSGTTVAQTLFADQKQSARTQSFTWSPDPLPDGRYRFVVTARLPSGEEASAGQVVVVDRTLALFGVNPAVFSPNGDGASETTAFTFTLAKPAHAVLNVLAADGSVLTQLFAGDLQAGPQQILWDGSSPAGRVPDGSYGVQLTVTGALGDLVRQQPVVVDTAPPVLTLVSGPELRFSVSEQAAVTIVEDGQQAVLAVGPGDFQVPTSAPPAHLTAVATDAAGNTSAAVHWP